MKRVLPIPSILLERLKREEEEKESLDKRWKSAILKSVAHVIASQGVARGMREKEKQQGKNAFPVASSFWGQAKDLWTGGAPSRTFSPVPAHDPQGRYRRQVGPTPSYWQRCLAWLRYQSIQMRWDVERRLARMLHHRWGVKDP